MRLNETDLAIFNNKTAYINTFDRLKMLATSIFEWEGLDEIGGDSRFMELTLFDYGRAVFVKDETLGFMNLKVNPSDKLNVYNLPTKVIAWSVGYSKEYNYDDVVYIHNNVIDKPTSDIALEYAKRIYEVMRTTDINVIAQKTPTLLEGDPKTKLTIMNAYEQFTGNMPVIIGNKDYELNKHINAIKTDAPYLVDRLDDHLHDLWNDFITFLGINNANTDKRERLITSEVESNDDLVNYYLNCFYKYRKKACDEINNKFFNGEEKVRIMLNKDVVDLLKLNESAIFGNTLENAENPESNEVI